MPVSGAEVLVVILAIVPGFVLFFFLRQKIGAGHQTGETTFALQSLIGSVVVYALIAPLYFWGEGAFDWIPPLTVAGLSFISWQQYLGLLFSLLIVPAFVGLLIGWLLTHGRTQGFLFWVKLDEFSRAPSAWDARVLARKQPAWVIVETASSFYFGILDERGAVGDSSRSGDLFLSPQYSIDDQKTWHCMGEESGIWIRGDAIVSVQFRMGSKL
jgi:hypothetical protein